MLWHPRLLSTSALNLLFAEFPLDPTSKIFSMHFYSTISSFIRAALILSDYYRHYLILYVMNLLITYPTITLITHQVTHMQCELYSNAR